MSVSCFNLLATFCGLLCLMKFYREMLSLSSVSNASGVHADLPLEKCTSPIHGLHISFIFFFTSVLEHPQVVRFPAV
jgi:hypothetical protein